MSSELDPLFRVAFRHTEPVDTRHELRHEEKIDERRKRKQDGDNEKDDSAWTDKTEVSVQALQAFLDGLLRQASQGDHATAPAADSTLQNTEPAPAPHHDERAARATAAYQHTAHGTAYSARHSYNHGEAPAAPVTAGLVLSAEDIRAIHGLLDDLRLLDERGIVMLEILPGETFLQSLVDAARRAKSAL